MSAELTNFDGCTCSSGAAKRGIRVHSKRSYRQSKRGKCGWTGTLMQNWQIAKKAFRLLPVTSKMEPSCGIDPSGRPPSHGPKLDICKGRSHKASFAGWSLLWPCPSLPRIFTLTANPFFFLLFLVVFESYSHETGVEEGMPTRVCTRMKYMSWGFHKTLCVAGWTKEDHP